MTEFKTAHELGITADEHAAAILTIEVLKAEQIHFDMSHTCKLSGSDRYGYGGEATPPCGTNLCLGGTMSILMQNGMKLPDVITEEMALNASYYVNSHEGQGALGDLFWGETDPDIEPADGIAALKRFLSGKSPWSFL